MLSIFAIIQVGEQLFMILVIRTIIFGMAMALTIWFTLTALDGGVQKKEIKQEDVFKVAVLLFLALIAAKNIFG